MVFVTGATGLLGSHLLYHLVGKGQNVYALKRSSSRTDSVKEVFRQYQADDTSWEKVKWVEGDVLEKETLEPVISKADYVYHCAAVVSFSGADKDRLLDINLKGTENVACLCRKYKVRLCYVSSIAALGDARYEGEIVDEETPMILETIRSVYSQSKIAAENIVWKEVRQGADVVIANPSIILGPGHWGKSSSKLFLTASKGVPFYTEGICGYVDVRDVCKVLIRLAEDRSVKGERFVVSGGNYSYKALFTEIARAAGHRPPVINMRPWMTSLAWRMFAVAGKITGKQPAFTQETARSSHHKSYYSSGKLLEHYPDFRFYSLTETIYYIQEKYRQNQKTIFS